MFTKKVSYFFLSFTQNLAQIRVSRGKLTYLNCEKHFENYENSTIAIRKSLKSLFYILFPFIFKQIKIQILICTHGSLSQNSIRIKQRRGVPNLSVKVCYTVIIDGRSTRSRTRWVIGWTCCTCACLDWNVFKIYVFTYNLKGVKIVLFCVFVCLLFRWLRVVCLSLRDIF